MKTFCRFILLILLWSYGANTFADDNTKYLVGDFYYSMPWDGIEIAEVSGTPTTTGDITIPEEVTLDGMKCDVELVAVDGFRNNVNLTSVSFPNSILIIREHAFDGCTSLQKLKFSEGLDAIYAYAFNNCTGITQVSLPSSLTSISYQVFKGCDNITLVNANMTEPFDTFDQVFTKSVYKNARLVVPTGTADKYRSKKGWDLFVHIEEIGTGIDAIYNTESKTENSYNLSGQKVSDAYKGIVIRNGKKVIIK